MSYISTVNTYHFLLKMALRKYTEGEGLVILLLPAAVLKKNVLRAWYKLNKL